VLHISKRAEEELLAILAGRGFSSEAGLRISILSEPQEGYRYRFHFGVEEAEGDALVQAGPLVVRLDPSACRALEEVELDFLEDLLNRGFVFRNLNDSAIAGYNSFMKNSTTDTAVTASAAPPALVSLTQKAANEVLRILKEKKMPASTGLRISVKGGGCSGMTYVLDFSETGEATDQELEVCGVKVFVDDAALEFVGGMEIDFVDDLLNRGFKFSNPNASHSCGCGTSFSV
jgi:iron-sulfur cluster assembly protein